MSKLVRAGLEAVTTVVVTLAIIVTAFGAMFGLDELLALSGLSYAVWAVLIVIAHLALARRRRHIRLGVGVAIGVAVMAAHLVMFLIGGIGVAMNVVPVILHDFGFALIAMTTLNLVHLVVFRRRLAAARSISPVLSERVDGIPAPGTPAPPDQPEDPAAAQFASEWESWQVKSA